MQYFGVITRGPERKISPSSNSQRRCKSRASLSYGELKPASLLGPAPRRSALRKNRRLVRAERTVKLNHAVLRKGATLVIT